MTTLRSVRRFGMTCGIVTAVLCSLGPAVATADSVRGHGKVTSGGSEGAEITVNAWVDSDGKPDGFVLWIGPVAPDDSTGSSQRLLLDVIDLSFDGNTAYVLGVVFQSDFPDDIGHSILFSFTDNSGTGEDDVITATYGAGSFTSVTGNITVDDN